MNLALQAFENFENSTVTVSINTTARRLGGTKNVVSGFTGTKQIYTFPDGSSLTVSGRGKAHKVEVSDPPVGDGAGI